MGEIRQSVPIVIHSILALSLGVGFIIITIIVSAAEVIKVIRRTVPVVVDTVRALVHVIFIIVLRTITAGICWVIDVGISIVIRTILALRLGVIFVIVRG